MFVLATRFPPDDRSVGYERGTAISKAWDEATTDAAIEAAGYVAEHLQRLAGADPEQRRQRAEAAAVLLPSSPSRRSAGRSPTSSKSFTSSGSSKRRPIC